MNYRRIHDSIIERARNRDIEGYSENHHIIPRCLGGSDDRENLIKLTASEHYIIHLLLHRMYPENKKLEWAYIRMVFKGSTLQLRRKVSNKTYQECRNKVAILNRENTTGRKHIYCPITKERKLVPSEEVSFFIDLGWKLGNFSTSTKGRRQIIKDGKKKYVTEDKLDKYLLEGWTIGGLAQSNGGWNGKRKGKNNPAFGRVWVYHKETKQSITILKEELGYYLENSYIKGRYKRTK